MDYDGNLSIIEMSVDKLMNLNHQHQNILKLKTLGHMTRDRDMLATFALNERCFRPIMFPQSLLNTQLWLVYPDL